MSAFLLTSQNVTAGCVVHGCELEWVVDDVIDLGVWEVVHTEVTEDAYYLGT